MIDLAELAELDRRRERLLAELRRVRDIARKAIEREASLQVELQRVENALEEFYGPAGERRGS